MFFIKYKYYLLFLLLVATMSCHKTEEIYILPNNYKGHCIILFKNNLSSIKPDSSKRFFYLDTSGLCISDLDFKETNVKRFFLIQNIYGKYDTLANSNIPSPNSLDLNSISLETIHRMKKFGFKDIFVYTFFVGEKEEDFFQEEFNCMKRRFELIENDSIFNN
jgi:hypothetical protein